MSPQVWCLSGGVQPEEQINRTVDGAVLSVLLTGLLPDTSYTVTVAAVTGLGVGALSPPISLLSEWIRSPFKSYLVRGEPINSEDTGVVLIH